MDAQRRILRSVFDEHGGHEMGTEGDSFFIVFASARHALMAAVEGQRLLYQHDWPDGVPVRVRMGMHTGEPTQHDEGYFGIDVHRAARVAAIAHGGQIVISEATRQLVSDVNEGVSRRDLGWHRLKDIKEPEHLYDVVVEGLPSQFPALRSLGTLANLPTIGTILVGRDIELDELNTRFERDDVRLVTLTGTGEAARRDSLSRWLRAWRSSFPPASSSWPCTRLTGRL